MSKKVDSMTPEERAKKYGNEIMGIGIIYLVLYGIVTALSLGTLFSSPVRAVIVGLQIAMLIFMIIGGYKKNKTGVKAALAFEIYMIVASILSIALRSGGPDIVGLIVMICLPFDIKGLSKAIKDMENLGTTESIDNNIYTYDNNNDSNNPFN